MNKLFLNRCQYFGKIQFNSVFIRIYATVIIFSFLPVILMGYAFYFKVSDMLQKEFDDVNLGYAYRIRDSADTLFKEIELVTAHIGTRTTVEYFMASNSLGYINSEILIKDGIMMPNLPMLNGGNFDLFSLQRNLHEIINTFVNIYKYMDSIYIYSDTSDFVVSNRTDGGVSDFKDQSWIPFYEALTGNNYVIIPREEENTISLIRSISTSKENKIGCVVLNLNIEELNKLFSTLDNPINQNIFIMDKDGEIFYSNSTDVEKIEIIQKLYSENKSFTNKITIGDATYFLSVSPSKHYDWNYISIIPNTNFLPKTNEIQYFFTLFLTIWVIVGFVIAFIIANTTAKPIKNIITAINQPEGGISDRNKETLYEIRYIISRFTSAMDINKKMKKELEEYLLRLSKAQVAALQAQINPHFLYNTLESIKWMTLELTDNQPNIACKTISNLSDLLRLGMGIEKHLVSIEDEIHISNLYLEVLKVRDEDKFSIEWNIEDEVKSYSIVKLTLQPFIENALYHGIKKKQGRGKIVITGFVEGELIRINVVDDGVGMPQEHVISLNRQINEDDAMQSKHIGIKNVNHRLKLFYGSGYGVEIESALGLGTMVKITIPKVK